MKASELRIGNLVYGVSDRIETVIGINGNLITSYVGKLFASNMESDEADYNPIPLNDKWLLKFGFEEIDNRFFLLRFIVEHGIGQFFGDGYSFRITTSGTESTHASSIKYVHQLQNLYRELTGEDLKLIEK